jgi:D-serine deaminase-like pyridoxal phosphate-dependent protein
MQSRRKFMVTTFTAPAVLAAAARGSYSWGEIEKMIEHGDVKGKLTRADLPTPALLLDLDAFESNVSKMAAYLKAHGRAFRPHGKTHKCPEIAKRLVTAGAVGACAAKISEAEVFAAAGVRGLLVTTCVVGPYKIERAIRLAKLAPDTIFCVDNMQNARDLNDAAQAARITLPVAIDLWVGNRTGILPGAPAVALAEGLQDLKNLKLTTMQAYAGHAAHVIGFDARKKVSTEQMGKAVDTVKAIHAKGIECGRLTGGSTGTYNIDCEIDGVTEIQPGSFMFMDVDYNRIGGSDGNEFYGDFKNSLTVFTTVVSKPSDALAIVDGGLKAFSTDKPFPPRIKDGSAVTFAFGGDEHGKLTFGAGAKALNVGDKAEFVIPHCDPSVNLYDKLFCLRGDNVEAVWKIAARGMAQ